MRSISPRKLWLAAVAVILVLLIALWGSGASISYHSPLRCCVFDPGTGGGLGLVLWARQLGIPARGLEDPLWEAVERAEFGQGNCFLTAGDGSFSPWGEELTGEEWLPIKRWIARGNALIVLTTKPSALPKSVIDDVLGSTPEVYPGASGPSKSKSAAVDEIPFFESSVPENPPVTTVALTGGQSLTVRADGPRWPEKLDRGETAADSRGVVWFRKEIGKGAIYILLDDFAWTNTGFDHPGNAEALAAVLAREVQGGVFGFDEYRHGHGRVESFSTFLLRLPGAGNFCLIAAVLVGIYFFGRNVRFGPPEPFVVAERRTAREYVEAAAFLNQRARAAPLAVESIVRRIRAVSLRRGHLNPDIQELLREAERFIASGARPANPSAVCALARKLIALRKKLYGT
jgi:hypothetical protein